MLQESSNEYVNVDERGIPRPPPRRRPPGSDLGARPRTGRPRPIYDDRQYQDFLDTGRRESLFSDPAIVDYHSLDVSRHPRGLPDDMVEGRSAQASGGSAWPREGSGEGSGDAGGGNPVLPPVAYVSPPFPLKNVYFEVSLPKDQLLPPPYRYQSCGSLDWYKSYTRKQDFHCVEVLQNTRMTRCNL